MPNPVIAIGILLLENIDEALAADHVDPIPGEFPASVRDCG